MRLKNYQIRTLDKLATFLDKARYTTPTAAFAAHQEASGYSTKYKTMEKLEDIPYVCLRLPTGGGKTMLSAHAVAVATDKYLEVDFPIVLWLAPTDIIRTQTLETLKNPLHPNREALDRRFGGRVRVFDITDFEQVRPQDIGQSVCVFLATFAAFRVNSTDGRRVYAHNENMEPHFGAIPPADYMEKNGHGEVKFSFANLLAYHRPLVIVDEAHNNVSKLSVEVLQRLRPAAVVEFTATPADNSNVLYKVSASELKAEDMIKLPVRLAEHKSWEDAVANAVQTRQRLDQLAGSEDQYIRPIVLFQAESKDKDVTVEVILKQLLEQENIPREEIAIATGDQRELDGLNLFDPACPVKYVITVQALKEGWDCSFAYVFCSTARVQSAKDAEQLLGRVLRMPYAQRRRQDDLNRAYAHVSVTTWAEAVGRIRDNMIGMGFEDVEADSSIQYQPPLFEEGDIIAPTFVREDLVMTTAYAPDLTVLNLALQAEAKVEKTDAGYQVTIVVNSHDDLKELEVKAKDVFTAIEDRHELIKKISEKKGRARPLSPAEKGETITIPQLCLDFGDGCSLAEREAFLPDGWDLLAFPVSLDGFQVSDDGHFYEIDVEGAKIKERALTGQEALAFGTATHWTDAQLIDWLDRKLRQPDILHASLVEFLRRYIRYLQDYKRVELADLVRLRYMLEKLLRDKIGRCRDESYKAGVQDVLIKMPAVAQLSPEATVVFREGLYPCNNPYRGSFKFDKHFFPLVGAMNGEETDCAKALEMNPAVKVWVRNLERPECSFWLPTHRDKFYPDFVAELADGRILAVEYKGEHLVTAEDAEEKHMIGRLWAAKSGDKCLFLMATKRDGDGRDVYAQIASVVGTAKIRGR